MSGNTLPLLGLGGAEEGLDLAALAAEVAGRLRSLSSWIPEATAEEWERYRDALLADIARVEEQLAALGETLGTYGWRVDPRGQWRRADEPDSAPDDAGVPAEVLKEILAALSDADLIDFCRRRGAILFLEDGRLRVTGGAALHEETKAAIRSRQAGLTRALAGAT